MKIIEKYNPFDFQKQTIINALESIERFGGCCIFDETGLGKTITGATIANSISNNILVVSPKATQKSWATILPFAKICTNKKILSGQYDVIIIDESHHFNNDKNKTYSDLINLIYFESVKLPKVILLSATPFNNSFAEFGNMLKLIPFRPNAELFYGLPLVIKTLTQLEKELMVFQRYYLDENGLGKSFKKITDFANKETIFNNQIDCLKALLKLFCFRNERVEISKISNLKFPKITKHNILCHNNLDEIYLKSKTILDKVKFIVYQQNNETELDMSGIMRTFLWKRLDSSVVAFKYSLDKIISNYKNFGGLDGDLNLLIKSDLDYLQEIKSLWDSINDDYKLNILLDTINKIDGKIIIFTEFLLTQKQIYNFLISKGLKALSYNNESPKELLETIDVEFNYNLENNTNEYDILVTTDILSEGVNLHTANSLINYDLRWNPSRLIQREGRINRLISNEKEIKVCDIYNFQVNNIIEKEILLENKIERKSKYGNNLLSFKNSKVKYFNIKSDDIIFTTNVTNVRNSNVFGILTINGYFIFNEQPKLTSHSIETNLFKLNDFKLYRHNNPTIKTVLPFRYNIAGLGDYYEYDNFKTSLIFENYFFSSIMSFKDNKIDKNIQVDLLNKIYLDINLPKYIKILPHQYTNTNEQINYY